MARPMLARHGGPRMQSRIALMLTIAALTTPLAAALGPVEAPQANATHHVHMMVVGGAVFQYDPPVLQTAVGDTVVFHSHDIQHTATSGLLTETEPAETLAPGALNLNAFDTGAVAGGASSSVTIGGSGAYPYYCAIGFHRLLGMHGLIVAQ